MDTRPVVDHYTALMSVSLAGSSDRTDEGFHENHRQYKLYTVIFQGNPKKFKGFEKSSKVQTVNHKFSLKSKILKDFINFIVKL